MPINKELIEKRQEVKQNKPDFVRPESWRYVRLQTNWRKPKGIDHHQRKQKSRGRPGLVKVGYGGPADAPPPVTSDDTFCSPMLNQFNPENLILPKLHSRV